MPDTLSLLIIDPRFNAFEAIDSYVGKHKLRWKWLSHGRNALQYLQESPAEIIVCSLDVEDMDGLKLVQEIKQIVPSAQIIVTVSMSAVEKAAEALKLGIRETLLSPLSEPKLLQALEKVRLELSNSDTKMGSEDAIIAQSPEMQKVLSDVAIIAKSRANIFIHGESGTGKELIAKCIHDHSPRNGGAFIKVNCAAIPETLIESELFGHEKGAFTGAINSRAGRFELADGGTLFLDEISEVSMSIQPKLLRAIQELEFERLGSMETKKVDVRFVSTTNRNMLKHIEDKHFREDLYFRLNVIPVHLPPLRERKSDILPLANHFLKLACRENQRALKKLRSEAESKLLAYSWPGNIRELWNVIQRAAVMVFDESVGPNDILLEKMSKSQTASTQATNTLQQLMKLSEVEEKYILDTLEACNQNKTKAAKILDISVRTLRNKLNKASS